MILKIIQQIEYNNVLRFLWDSFNNDQRISSERRLFHWNPLILRCQLYESWKDSSRPLSYIRIALYLCPAQSQIEQKTVELDRYKTEHRSLQKIELEQADFINQLSFQN